MNLHTNRRTAVVHHKMIGFADIELHVIVVAPCDEAQSELSNSVKRCLGEDSIFVTGT